MIVHPLERPDIRPVLIVSGCPGATRRYRCLHHFEQLRLLGVPVRLVDHGHPEMLDRALGCGTVVLHRVAYDDAIGLLVEQTRDSGGVVLFDIDDLVFEPESTHHHHGMTLLPPDEQDLYHDGVRRYRRTLLASDAAIVPTAFLAERVRALDRPALVSRNCVDLELLRRSERAAASRDARHRVERGPADAERVVIGYASGSRTHDLDFAEAAGPAVRRVLARHPEAVLRIVGPLALGPAWDGLAAQVERVPVVDWRELPAVIAGFDISLAPLEVDNPFCRAKSELKWLEAAACGVPTVASATEAFAAAIDDGRTGFLALDTREWADALEVLLADAARRQAMGDAAHDVVAAERSTAAQASGYWRTLRAARAQIRPDDVPPAPDPGRAPRVSVLLPEPVKGSGGHTSIFRMAAGLAEAGHEVHMHIDRGAQTLHATEREVESFCRAHFPVVDGAYHVGRDFVPSDVALATGWATALGVAKADNVRVGAYFVQDYEPYIYPLGLEATAAEATYRLGLRHITLGPWLAERLRARYDAFAVPIPFGVDHDRFHPGPPPDRPRVAFYARPQTARRGTGLGLEALAQVKAARPDCEVVLYGTDEPGLSDFEYTPAGVLSQDELAHLFRRSTVGLVLSYTNMSFVPLELMASGAAVVAVDTPPVRWFLEHERNCLLAESRPQELAAAVLRLLDDPALHARLVAAGRQSVSGLDWSGIVARFESHVRGFAREGQIAAGTYRPARSRPDAVPPRLVLDQLAPEPGRADVHPRVSPSGLADAGADSVPVDATAETGAGAAAETRAAAGTDAAGAVGVTDTAGSDRADPAVPGPAAVAHSGAASDADAAGDAPAAGRRLGAGPQSDGVATALGGVPLDADAPLAWTVRPARDGWCAVDVRASVDGPRRGQLVLRVREAPGSLDDLATASVGLDQVSHGDWLPLVFPSLGETAGRRYHVVLALHGAAPATSVVLDTAAGAVGTGADDAPGRAPEDPQIAYRTYALDPPAAAGTGHDPLLARQLAESRRRRAWLARQRAQLDRWRGAPLVRAWRRLTRPMPPPALRPWPADRPAPEKLLRALVRYGPVAAVREVTSYVRWRSGTTSDGHAA